jgi:5-methylcytosine-specific restriction endonuclease McrA
MRVARLGEKNPAWRGGIAKRNRKDTTADYKFWRMAVFSRDDYTCQYCLERGGKLNAHHIKSYKLYPELRVDVNNGLTLCSECHRNLHGNRVIIPERRMK